VRIALRQRPMRELRSIDWRVARLWVLPMQDRAASAARAPIRSTTTDTV
jgi:hypothetical protein